MSELRVVGYNDVRMPCPADWIIINSEVIKQSTSYILKRS